MNKSNIKIKELRVEKGYTQEYVAKFIGLDRSNYSKYELGKLDLSSDMLISLAKLYDVTVDYILGLED